MKDFSLYRTNRGRLQPMYPRYLVQVVSAIVVALALSHLSQPQIFATTSDETTSRPNIVLIMADDMGWGQTGYYGHPILKTPNLDAMAANGLRFDRFYAGAPNCSPTRASIMTGRSNDRTGVLNHGYPLRRQEKTVAQALKAAGYATSHFGKWHLNGLRGPGVPILKSDVRSPGGFGFDTWLSVTNFFDRDPIMSRNGRFEEFAGDSSEIIVDQALQFIRAHAGSDQPFFTVIWYGTPHNPFVAAEEDTKGFSELNVASRDHYGELVAMDRSIGTLRAGLRELKIADNTLFWFCSDNGGLPKIQPETVGGLRGFKGSVYEGGLRVPAIIEWPAGIKKPRITNHPSCTMDIFPTLAEIVGLDDSVMFKPQDGVSLKPLLTSEIGRREKPIPFRHQGRAALIDNDWKLIAQKMNGGRYELYNLKSDPKEKTSQTETQAEIVNSMSGRLKSFIHSVDASIAGKDYPEGKVNSGEPEPRFWMTVPEYEPYFAEWKKRPEYRSRFK